MQLLTKKYTSSAALFLAVAILAGCGGAGTSSVGTAAPVKQGITQNVVAGSMVTLDGSAAVSSEGMQTYRWTLDSKPAGSNARLSNPTSPLPSFTADLPGTYIVTVQLSNDNIAAAVGSGSSATYTITATLGNVAPVANAGAAQNVMTGTLITLDGSASSDVDNNPLTYRWSLISKPAGSAATLASSVSATPTFSADVVGTYVARLIVNDGAVDSAYATVNIIATSGTNAMPVANAGVAQNSIAGALVTLDGSASSDANGDLLTYQWNWIYRPTYSSAVLLNATTLAPSFRPDLAGVYVLSLKVNDGTISSAPTTVVITVTAGNAIPVAHAGTAQNVTTGTLITLNGSASSDANSDPLTYRWSFIAKPAGSLSALARASTVNPIFSADLAGTYVAQLIVNDGKVNSATATVVVTATAGNAVPVANAGATQTVYSGTLVTLNGSASSDANSDPLTYQWTLSTKPAGSTATLAGKTTVTPMFTADLAGTYVASLIVKDGQVNSAVSNVIINAAPNVAPVANAGAAQTVGPGAVVTLNGSASTDANSDQLSYSWTLTSVPAGSSATLSNANQASPSFTADLTGTYIASLVVNDGAQNSAVATVTITAAIFPPGYVAQGGLIWMPITFYDTWTNADTFCANFSVIGISGWRMPTQPELSTLYASGAMNGQGWTLYHHWSSTQALAGSHYAVALIANLIPNSFYAISDNGLSYVSCVR